MLNQNSPARTDRSRTHPTAISHSLLGITLIALLALTGCVSVTLTGEYSAPQSGRSHRAIAGVLDSLHAAAATADEDLYFDLYAPEAVFLGTDAGERWTIEEFHDWARQYFQRDSAWVYRVLDRHITMAPGGRIAWFDERLHNDRLGECRGSGALRLIDGRWRITQYNLSIPIPNDLADEVVGLIRANEPGSPE